MRKNPLFVLNLDRSKQRIKAVGFRLRRAGLPFTRISAVDAEHLSPVTIAVVCKKDPDRYFAPLHKGEIACFLTHRKAWAALLASGEPWGVVFEDDVVPGPCLADVLVALGSRPATWDVIKLHGSSFQIAERVGSLTEEVDLVRPSLVALSGSAYCISRAGAEKLLAGTLPFSRPVDVELQHWWEHGLAILATSPWVVAVAGHAAPSTLKRYQDRTWPARISREIRRPVYRLGLAVRSCFERWRSKNSSRPRPRPVENVRSG